MNSHTIVIDFQEISVESADAQIKRLQSYIQKLQTVRNALLPISRLPSDVLLNIFSLVGTQLEINSGRSLLALSCVSHYWRDLTLGCPSLWTTITSSNLRGAIPWLAHSGSAPLMVALYDLNRRHARIPMDQLVFVLSQMPRIKVFHCCQSGFLVIFPEFMWQTPAPLLTSLKLEGVRLEGHFLPQIPNITSISLRRCQFSWAIGTKILPSLTSLYVYTPKFPIPVNEFVDLLYRMPALKSLVLVGVFSSLEDRTPPSPQHYGGPLLQKLKLQLDQDVQESLQFLQYALPRFTTNQTTIACSFRPGKVADDLLELLSTFTELVSPKQVTSVQFKSEMFYLNYKGVGVDEDICRTTLVIILDIPRFSRLILSGLQPHLSFLHVKAVKIDNGSIDWTTSRLAEVFGCLPNLEYFDIRTYSCSFNLVDLLKTFMLTDGDTNSPLSFASLKVLGCIPTNDKAAHTLLFKICSERMLLGHRLESVILDSASHSNRKRTHGLRELGKIVRYFQAGGDEVRKIESALFESAEPFLYGPDVWPFADD